MTSSTKSEGGQEITIGMDQHRVAVFTGPGQIQLRSESPLEPGPGEVLLQVRACALCTMEQRLWQGAQDDYPIAAGHEAAGVVIAAHREGTLGLAAGERAALAFLDRCMQCEACRRGETNLCTGKLRSRARGTFRRIGGLADFVVVPAWKVFRMPADLSFDEIALCEPVACVIHSVHQARLRFGDDVLVIGGGTMGRLHLMLARLRGSRVFVSDPDPEKRRGALSHGASAAFPADETTSNIQQATGGRGVDAVFVTFGSQDTARQASEVVRRGGRIVYYGGFPEGIDSGLDPRRMHQEEIVVSGARGQTLEDWQEATRLLAAGLIDVKPLITGRYPLNDLPQALEHAVRQSSFRIIVNP